MSDTDSPRPRIAARRLELAAYPFTIPFRLLWGDADLLGHINNVAIGRYLDETRVSLFREIFAGGLSDTVPVRGMLATLTATYLAETLYPGEVTVATSIGAIGRTSITEWIAVFQGDRCTVVADAVIVWAGPEGPSPIPDFARAAAERHRFRDQP